MKKVFHTTILTLQLGSAWASGLEWDPDAKIFNINQESSVPPERAVPALSPQSDIRSPSPVMWEARSHSACETEIIAASENPLNIGFITDSDDESSENSPTMNGLSPNQGTYIQSPSLISKASSAPINERPFVLSDKALGFIMRSVNIFDIQDREMMIITSSNRKPLNNRQQRSLEAATPSPIPTYLYDYGYFITFGRDKKILFSFALMHDSIIYKDSRDKLIHEVPSIFWPAGSYINGFCLLDTLHITPQLSIHEIAARLNRLFLSVHIEFY
ncbi:MAG: hypothetical protein Q8K36_03550 [Alphaproteobacteria bacterium]|nr:hypothetical protein [Alphaproteobacteria bacterium]